MMDFAQFESVYYFFVKLEMDHTYVKSIDDKMKSDDNDSTVQLISQIKNFHKMRKELCQSIFNHFEKKGISNSTFDTFNNSSGVLEYSNVPDGAVCVFTGIKLSSKNGFMIIVDKKTPLTIDKRFKNIIYNFWYILHLPKEITKEAIDFLKNKKIWRDGRIKVDEIVDKLKKSKNNIFAKRAYVKLSSVCKYIQYDMMDIPINSRDVELK